MTTMQTPPAAPAPDTACGVSSVTCPDSNLDPEDVVETVVDAVSSAVAAGTPIDEIGEAAGDVAGAVVTGAADVAVEALGTAGNEMATTAFTTLAAEVAEFGGETSLDIGGLELTFNSLALAIAVAGLVFGLARIMWKGRQGAEDWLSDLGTYMIVGAGGVTAAMWFINLVDGYAFDNLTYSLPSEFDVEAASVIYTGAFAAVIVPILVTALAWRVLILGVLVGMLAFSAAIRTWPGFKAILRVNVALLVATVMWPLISVILIGQSFEAVPDWSKATWLIVASIAVIPFAYGIAILSMSVSRR